MEGQSNSVEPYTINGLPCSVWIRKHVNIHVFLNCDTFNIASCE